MKPLREPVLPWMGREWDCPHCGFVCEWELADLGGVRRLSPKYNQFLRKYSVYTDCPRCRMMGIFWSTPDDYFLDMDGDAHDAPAGGAGHPTGQPAELLRGVSNGDRSSNLRPSTTTGADAPVMRSGVSSQTLAPVVPARDHA